MASAAVLGPMAVGLVWLGGWWTTGLAVVAFTLAAGEFVGLVTVGAPWWRRYWPGLLLLLLALPLAPQNAVAEPVPLVLAGTAVALIGVILEFVRSRSPEAVRGFAAASGSLVYLAPPMACGLLVAGAPDGALLLLLLAASVVAFDSCAYALGRAIGRNRLAPAISPGKTWEGLAGGVLGSLAAGAVFSIWIEAPTLVLAPLAAMVGLAGQAGDLLESALKRSLAVKDASGLIPGHGGMLDRIDSFTTALPAGLALLLAAGLLR